MWERKTLTTDPQNNTTCDTPSSAIRYASVRKIITWKRSAQASLRQTKHN